jgi:hypothetical protein
MKTNVEQMNTEQKAFVLSSPQEMDLKMSEENKNKPDSTSVAENKNKFQEVVFYCRHNR